jgi:RNA-directed DNA polymerase
MQATLRRVRDELMRRRHLSVNAQGKWIGAVVRGYFAYHAVPTNGRSLAVFQKEERFDARTRGKSRVR